MDDRQPIHEHTEYLTKARAMVAAFVAGEITTDHMERVTAVGLREVDVALRKFQTRGAHKKGPYADQAAAEETRLASYDLHDQPGAPRVH